MTTPHQLPHNPNCRRRSNNKNGAGPTTKATGAQAGHHLERLFKVVTTPPIYSTQRSTIRTTAGTAAIGREQDYSSGTMPWNTRLEKKRAWKGERPHLNIDENTQFHFSYITQQATHLRLGGRGYFTMDFDHNS